MQTIIKDREWAALAGWSSINSNASLSCSEAGKLLESADETTILALKNLAQIQGNTLQTTEVRELFPLLKVYLLFPDLEETERELLVRLYQTRHDLARNSGTRFGAFQSKADIDKMRDQFMCLREKTTQNAIPARLSSVQRAVLENEFLSAPFDRE